VTQLIKGSIELIAVDQTADGNRAGAEIARTVEVLGGISIDQRTMLGVPEEVEEVIEEQVIVEVIEKCYVKTRDENGMRVNTDIEIPCAN